MARVLVATIPGQGHVNPVLPVARALVERGHEVRWYTGAHFRDRVEGTGAAYRPMRSAYDHGGMNRQRAFPELDGLRGRALFQAAARRIFIDPAPDYLRDIVALLAEAPADVLVADEMCFGAGLAHEIGGPPLVTIATSIYFFPSRDTAPLGLALPPGGRVTGLVRNRLLAFAAEHLLLRDLWQAVDDMRASLDLRPRSPHAFATVAAPPALYLLGTVPSFEYPRRDLFPYTHFVGPLIEPAGFAPPPWWPELAGDRPVVHVTQGTVSNGDTALIGPAIRALASEDVLTVVTTGGTPPGALDLGPVPANLRLSPFLPHQALLPHVDVMVSNGGYGGVQAALAAGVPLVIAGATEEKPEVAAHVAWSGAGVDLRTGAPSPERLRRAVRHVLDTPAYRQRARQIQAECRAAGGPTRAAKLIESVA